MQNFKGIENLSAAELHAYNMMENVSQETGWGLAIKNVYRDPEPAKIRLLISQLNSQAIDNPEAMQQILGKAYDSIISK